MVSRCVLLGLFFVSSGAQGCQHPTRAPQTQPKTGRMEQALARALNDVQKMSRASYQVMLREAWLRVPPLLKDKNWSEVEPIFTQLALPVVEEWENGDFLNVYYLLKKRAFVFRDGQSLDMQVFLRISQNGPQNKWWRPGTIVTADVLLAKDGINIPYDQFMSNEPYPKGSALDLALREADVRTMGQTWPLLKAIRVHYGPFIFRSSEEYSASGYHVEVEFAASATQRIGGTRMVWFIESTPDDALGVPLCSGGVAWWSGDPETVEVNQHEYLRRQP
jgi:hypothetical protein